MFIPILAIIGTKSIPGRARRLFQLTFFLKEMANETNKLRSSEGNMKQRSIFLKRTDSVLSACVCLRCHDVDDSHY